jgi:hypothetical protein
VEVCATVGRVLDGIRDLNRRMGGALATVEPMKDGDYTKR